MFLSRNNDRHASPHDSLSAARRSHGTGVNHSAQLRQGSARLVSKGSKTICRQRSKTKSSVMSLKKSSLESVVRGARHYSTQQNVKFTGNGTSKRRVLQTMINDANRNSSFVASVERQPRSYAQMIADYSKAIRKASTAVARNDDVYFSNASRKSPFSTLTSLDKQAINIAKRSGVSSKGRANDSLLFNPLNPFDRSIRYDSTDISEATNQTCVQVTESKSEDRSYVKLVADCSKSAYNVSVASNGALTPRLNLLTRSSLEPFAAPARNASSTNSSQRISRKASRVVAVETSRQSSTQVSTSTSKQPQVELHMVPSAKESVVSINVDSVSARLSSPLKLASEELSVVVRSNQKAAASAPRSSETPWNAPTTRQSANNSALRHRGDFGPMRISISEDSAPIKQIEFSINGKPVSELKSIVARTERLDVVTSPDKIEIRVPFAKDDAASRSRAEDELRQRSDSSVQQILNVQISANFQNESTKGSTDRPHNAPKISTTTSTPSPQAPATRSLLGDPAGVPSATLDSDDNARQRNTSARTDIKAGDTIKGKIDGRRISSGSRNSKVQRETTKKLSADESAMDVSTIARASDAEGGKLRARKIMNPRYSSVNKHDKNESHDTRVPTNMIPWWSSSDSFNRIRKKKDNRKPADWSENKLPNQPSTKPAESTNNTAVVANNSSDMISHSLQQEFKPTIHYPSLFRLKPNRENPDSISEVTRNGLKVKTVQTPDTEKDGETISSVKRTEPVTLAALETTNVQNKRVASGELGTHVKKASVLPRKFKAPKDTPDAPLKQDREKKSNYPLKETHSIDDTFSKAKVRDILDNMKPLEKREDGSLIDYGFKMSSRKSTIKLNSGVKEIRDPSPEVMKILWDSPDSTSKKCMTKTAPQTKQINKAAGLKRIGSDKVAKSEAKRTIPKEEDDPIVKDLLVPADVKARDENPVKNTKGLEQDRPKSSSSISVPAMTEIQKSGKLNRLKSSELSDTRHPFKELTDKQMIQRKKSPFAVTDTTKSSSQTKSNPTWKIKDHNPLTDSIEKKRRGTLFARRAADKLAKTTGNAAAAVEIAKQTSASGDLSTKNRQENRSRKSKSALDKRNPAGSTDPPKKPGGSAGLKSADPKTRMRTDVKFSESRANFSGSQLGAIGSASPWAHVDRPEKNVLYSAWLQRFKNNVGKHEKLF